MTTTKASRPTDPKKQIARLKQKVRKLKQEAETNLSGWQRARADLDNFKKRTSKKQKELVREANKEFFTEFLPVVDNFRKALSQIKEEQIENSWAKGFQYLLAQVESLLEQFKVTRISALGQLFDPSFHEAVETVPSDQKKGIIIEEVREGYLLGDEVILPSRVKVSSGPKKLSTKK